MCPSASVNLKNSIAARFVVISSSLAGYPALVLSAVSMAFIDEVKPRAVQKSSVVGPRKIHERFESPVLRWRARSEKEDGPVIPDGAEWPDFLFNWTSDARCSYLDGRMERAGDASCLRGERLRSLPTVDSARSLRFCPICRGRTRLNPPGVSGDVIPWKDQSHGTSQHLPARAS